LYGAGRGPATVVIWFGECRAATVADVEPVPAVPTAARRTVRFRHRRARYVLVLLPLLRWRARGIAGTLSAPPAVAE